MQCHIRQFIKTKVLILTIFKITINFSQVLNLVKLINLNRITKVQDPIFKIRISLKWLNLKFATIKIFK